MTTSIEQQFETLCAALSLTTRQYHLHRWNNFQWLDPYAIQELLQSGYTDIVQDAPLMYFTRGLYGDEYSPTVDAEKVWWGEGPFRTAWLEELSRTFASLSHATDWTERIFSLVAQERITSRQFLEARLQVSQATLSRAIQELREAGTIIEEPIPIGPGRPVKALSLTQAGMRKAQEMDIPTAAAPALQSSAIAERFFHQRISAIYFHAYPSASIQRAYTDETVQVDSALGSIYPDLVIQHNQDTFYIEAESGAYEYKRLRTKLDKYLASQLDSLWVITESQKAPTASHIRQWVHDRNSQPLENIPSRTHLRVLCTSLDQLQRFGPEGNIWQIFQFGQADKTPVSSNLPDSQTGSHLRDLFADWKRSLEEDEFIPGCFSLEEPFILRNENGREVDRLQADIVLKVLSNSIFQIFLEQPALWSVEHIRYFLEVVDHFLKSDCSLHRKTYLYPDYPWLYGAVHLIHLKAGESDPNTMASVYGLWRQASLAFQLAHGYPLIIRMAHMDNLRGITYLNIPEIAWELSGLL